MFKFNFSVEKDENNDIFGDDKESKEKSSTGDSGLMEADAKKIEPTEEIVETLDLYELNCKEIRVGSLDINYIIPKYLLESFRDEESKLEGIKKAECDHTDLIPGVYEGGAKLWECTDDLLSYLAENTTADFWQGKSVLDLGCGSGLLGVYALKCGANVDFQDYNEDVLEKITIPNVLLNVLDKDKPSSDLENIRKVARFYSGDWSKFSQLIKDEPQYDIVLTCETIYNPDNQKKLLDTICTSVKPNGIVYLAAKIYYFGVGGGIKQFQELIEVDKRLTSTIKWTSTDGVNREILEIKFR